MPGNVEIAADELAAVLLLENNFHRGSRYFEAVWAGIAFLTDVAEVEDLRHAFESAHGPSEHRAHRLLCLVGGANAAHPSWPADNKTEPAVPLDSTARDTTRSRVQECKDGYDHVVRTWFELLTPSVHWGGGTAHLFPPSPPK